ncbi:hypothetical protein Tco_1433085 [Tanacetum coccineum]
MSKPLPLQGPPGHLTVPVEFFFNNDLEYLNSIKVAYDKDAAFGISHWVPNVRYGYLKKIVVRREDLKEYSFREADFSRLHLNDIEDLFLLYVQCNIYNLSSDQILGVESYQKKLNITKPQTKCEGISVKEPFIIFYKSRGIVYLNRNKRKRLMRADELYKFCDGTLKDIRDNLHDMLQNFVLGYNKAMPTRKLSKKDQERTTEMLKLIDDRLLERWILRSLECYVGGRLNETDYRLRMRTI